MSSINIKSLVTNVQCDNFHVGLHTYETHQADNVFILLTLISPCGFIESLLR